MGSERLYISTM